MTTTTITAPGVYLSMPKESYHAKPTPTFPLSAGFAMTMDSASPAKAWYDSPLNPNYVPENKKEFDIGSAAHLILLENDVWQEGCRFIEADSYRANAAKDARDAAYEHGLVPLLPQQVDLILAMRDAFHNALPGLPFATAPDFAAKGLGGGDAELSVFSFDAALDIWCKCRPDYRRIGDKLDVLVDYKTMSLGHLDLSRYAANMGWHRRAAWYCDIYREATGRDAEYWFICQEKEAPHFVTVAKLDDRALEWGHRLNQVTKRRFAACMASGSWPSHVGAPVTIELPAWEDRRYQDMEDAGHFKGRAPVDPKMAKAVADACAPSDLTGG